LCDRALLVAFTGDRRKITSRTVALAFRDVMLKPAVGFLPNIGKRGTYALLALLMVITGYIYLAHERGPADLVVEKAREEKPLQKGDAKPVVKTNGAPAVIHRKTAIQPVVKPHSEITVKPFSPPTKPSRSAAVPSLEKESAPIEAAAPGQKPQEKTVSSDISMEERKKTALQAFNALASVMKVAPINMLGDRSSIITQLKMEAAGRGLSLDGFSGRLDELIRHNVPALVDISPKGMKGSLLVALTGSRHGRVNIHPSLMGRSSFRRDEILPLWSGHAYILWRNNDKIRLPLTAGDSGSSVIRMQILLQSAGATSLEVNGVFDDSTRQAVREFQRSSGIRVTGKVGPLTLIQLYRVVTEPSSPETGERAGGGV
ncbi:MAG TPA: peptidoglycan-binding domain-containing protein, partial [Geobacteraceae bacterium]|nr:peptidoglycan-binding domain-containing protein [Geobacteraceae bacterium]